MALMAMCMMFPAFTVIADEAEDGEWKLIWSDEFDKPELDAEKWSRCERGRPDWSNTMSDDPGLVEWNDGVLHLRGIVNPDREKDPSPFLTAGITSKGKFEFTYGKIEVRARFKSARGAWPALWMLGSRGSWPGNGEIDLMEHLNFDDFVYQTVHSAFTQGPDARSGPKSGGTARIDRDEFNTYGLIWEKDELVFLVNGEPTHRYPRVEELGPEQWPFSQPFYLIFSMQIGGNWVGEADPADYPAGMEIDWVRVHQRKP